jgi:SulP family sulfate permease
MAEPPKPEGRAGDAWGGLASMLVALPSAIAYGVTIYAAVGSEHAGRGALAGILGCVALGIAAPLVGGARFLVSAPCGPAAVLLAALAAEYSHGIEGVRGPIPDNVILLVLVLVGLLAALLQFAYGAVGGGRLIKFIPYPVVAGYLSGVGVILLTSQVPKLLGLPAGMNGWTGLANPSHWETPGVIVGLVTIAGMLLGPRITKRVPGVIVGLAAGFATYALLGVFRPELRTLGGNHLVVGALGGTAKELAASFGDRFRALSRVTGGQLSLAVVPALTLSVLLSIDTLKTCVIVDSLTRTRHESNRVLRGQGIGNFLSSALGGMPGAGTMGATLVNISSGARTRNSGLLAGVFALVALALGTGFIPGMPNFVAWIPKAALAGIVVVVSWRMIDLRSLDLLRHRATVLDFVVILAVVVTAVTTSLIAASGVGLALAIMLFIREQIRGTVVRHRIPGSLVSSKRFRPPAHAAVLRKQGSQTTICELQGTLFFGTADQLFTILEPDLKSCRYLVLDCRRVQAVDYTAAHLLEQIEGTLTDRGAYLLFSNLPATLPTGQDLKAYFDTLGLVKRERNVRVFGELDTAIEWIEDRILDEAGLGEDVSAPSLDLAEFDLCEGLSAQERTHLAEIVEERSVAAGEAVFHAGDEGDEVYLIRRGRVEIVVPLEGGRRLHLATFSRQSFFGDLAFLDRGVRSADAIAAKETDLYVLSRARFNTLSMRHPDLGAMFFARFARSLSHRLRQTNSELRAKEED